MEKILTKKLKKIEFISDNNTQKIMLDIRGKNSLKIINEKIILDKKIKMDHVQNFIKLIKIQENILSPSSLHVLASLFPGHESLYFVIISENNKEMIISEINEKLIDYIVNVLKINDEPFYGLSSIFFNKSLNILYLLYNRETKIQNKIVYHFVVMIEFVNNDSIQVINTIPIPSDKDNTNKEVISISKRLDNHVIFIKTRDRIFSLDIDSGKSQDFKTLEKKLENGTSIYYEPIDLFINSDQNLFIYFIDGSFLNVILHDKYGNDTEIIKKHFKKPFSTDRPNIFKVRENYFLLLTKEKFEFLEIIGKKIEEIKSFNLFGDYNINSVVDSSTTIINNNFFITVHNKVKNPKVNYLVSLNLEEKEVQNSIKLTKFGSLKTYGLYLVFLTEKKFLMVTETDIFIKEILNE